MDDLKAKLLGTVRPANARRFKGSQRNVESPANDSSISSHHKAVNLPVAFGALDDQLIDDFRRRNSRGRGSSRLRREFLKKLAIALHSYGSSASRTEFLVEKAAHKLHVDVGLAIFPSLILLTFPGCNAEDAVHVLSVESELDCDKLGRVDQLANQVGIIDNNEIPLVVAYWKLKAIATSPPRFSTWWWRLFGYALSASTSAMLFFSGSTYDGLLSLPLGLLVGCFDILSSRSTIFGTLLNFTGALAVSFLARLFNFYLGGFKLCFQSMVLGSLVQLLPGLALTFGVSEMVAKSYMIGSSQVLNAMFAALQLGFGIAVGENLVFWDTTDISMDCEQTNFKFWWNGLWFLLFSVSTLVLFKSRCEQWLGMIVTSGVGYLVSTAASSFQLDSSASSVFAAFAVGVTGTIFSHIHGDVALVMTLAGILLLVPGGIGVKGIAALMEENVLSGMSFVFNMLVVGFCITLGLLFSKLVLPAALFAPGKTMAHNKSTLAAELENEHTESSSSDEEESMAI